MAVESPYLNQKCHAIFKRTDKIKLGQIPRKPAILNFCPQTRGKVGKHTLLDENYALNTKKLFTRADLEFLPVKLQLKVTDPNTGHENEAKLFSFVELSFESNSLL